MRFFCAIGIVGMVALTACAEAYRPPDPAPPSAWAALAQHGAFFEPQAKTSDGVGPFWWRQFGSEVLDRFVLKAMDDNPDVRMALARIEEARAGADYPTLFPEFSVQGGYDYAGGQSSLGGVDASEGRAKGGLAFAWDLDVWGRLHHEDLAREVVVARALAEYDHVRLGVLVEVVKTYLEFYYLTDLRKLTMRNIRLQKDTLRGIRLQHQAGETGALNVIRAEAQVLHSEAKIPDIDRALVRMRNRLAVMVGENPEGLRNASLSRGKSMDLQVLPVLTRPAALLALRPDIRAAELLFKEQVALKNVRTAELFPSVSLAGFLGLGDSSVYGASAPWSLGAGLLAPLLDFGRIESRIDQAEARKKQALAAYKKVVLGALEDVENALDSYVKEKAIQKKYEAEARKRRKAVRFARAKFEAGELGFLDVLNEEERLLTSETRAFETRFETTRIGLDLYRALGVLPSFSAAKEAVLSSQNTEIGSGGLLIDK